MKKITVKNVVEFRRTDEKKRLAFLNSLLREKRAADDGGGGDYWVSCLSAISNILLDKDKRRIGGKIAELEERIEETDHKGTKTRWQRNIDILYNFEDFDFDSLRPEDIHQLKKPVAISLVDIEDFPIECKPNFVFWFENDGFREIGATWFIAKLGGYKKSELGMFADIMHRYLVANYSDDYKINAEYCVAVDLVNAREVRYSQILTDEIKPLLGKTISEMRKLLPKGK